MLVRINGGAWLSNAIAPRLQENQQPNHANVPLGTTLLITLCPYQDLPIKDFDWTASADSAVVIDEAAKVWRVETRIPLKAICESQPKDGTKWRINFYRHDRAENAFLAFSPTLTPSFHTPARFGWLEFTRADK